MGPDEADLWRLLPLGYVLTVALETPVLVLGLAPYHSLSRRLLAGIWLTACTYPIVILVLPQVIWRPLGDAGYWPYVTIAEIFAPAAECYLFWLAFWHASNRQRSAGSSRRYLIRDFVTIVAANLVSFLFGGWLLNYLWD